MNYERMIRPTGWLP